MCVCVVCGCLKGAGGGAGKEGQKNQPHQEWVLCRLGAGAGSCHQGRHPPMRQTMPAHPLCALLSPVRVSPVYHLAVGGLWRLSVWAARLKENPPYPADGAPVSKHLVTIDPDFSRVRAFLHALFCAS